ncbi:MAG: T9SS type A sorting domain-containing protein [FCB group bacterium]|nr:T9SS type A sorting domain-containing protein [FCB group bacterium]
MRNGLKFFMGSLGLLLLLIVLCTLNVNADVNVLSCSICHAPFVTSWQNSPHANTQTNVATELAAEWVGQSPDSVINGSAAEDCIACHAPKAIEANGGMTEAEAMGFFFTTDSGLYTASTVADSTALWPHDSCTTCHNVLSDHPTSVPTLSLFNSQTATYDPMPKASTLCGQCHGSLRFSGTDHLRYDAWKASLHGHQTQVDVAGELATEWAGISPDSVINGSTAENCIACHAPTATKLYGGITEVQVLDSFFTTTGGFFTALTTAQDTAAWPYVACNACHDPHNPDTVSYFNSTDTVYQVMSSSDSLCGQCHGTLRFPDTDHLSYDLSKGTGGVGVADSVMMPGVKCVDCHMANDGVDGSIPSMYAGHSWAVFIPSVNPTFASCSNVACHTSPYSVNSALAIVTNWQATYQQLLDTATAKVAEAADSLANRSSADSANYDEALANLNFASGDESGGAHNAVYVQSLLNDAIQKANLVITPTGVIEPNVTLPKQFALLQNYPNPFNPDTKIDFVLPRKATVTLEIFNLLGEKVKTLVSSEKMTAGEKSVSWNGSDDAGYKVSSGIYFYRLTADNFVSTKKMLLLK